MVVRVAVGDCSVTESRRWLLPYQTGKTVHVLAKHTTNMWRTDARRRVCAAMVPYRWATRGTSLRELDYTHIINNLKYWVHVGYLAGHLNTCMLPCRSGAVWSGSALFAQNIPVPTFRNFTVILSFVSEYSIFLAQKKNHAVSYYFNLHP